MPLSTNWDMPVFVVGALGVAVVISGRSETERRASFLYNVRDQMTAGEMNLLNAELLRLSTTDALTGLANRRHFESELTQMWDDRRAQDLGVALIDVDNFKSFNDSAGHAAGDAALRQVAQALADALRDERDRAARYGGEEFVVLLPGVSRQDMAAMGERLRSAVSALAIEHPGQPGRVVSVSIGLAWCAASQRGGSTEDLLRDADRALYDAKDAGRNCVMLGESMRLAAQR